MHASLRALLSGIIDYAGLFPPAKLEMQAAIRKYRAYFGGPHGWMLGRMIVPVAKLDEFDACGPGLLPNQHAEEPWRLSVIASPAGAAASLDGDLERIEAFNERHEDPSRGRCIIDSIELRADSPDEIDDALDMIPEQYGVFVELPIHGDPRGLIAALAGTEAAAKVRTGGAAPENFPSPLELARFIWSCAMAETPFKATAGLHHPFRAPSATVSGAVEFGFVNVFIGAALVRGERIDARELESLLADEAPSSFKVEEGRIAYRHHWLSLDEMIAARTEFALSYGSCSFEEPIADLMALGLMPGGQAASPR